MSWLTIIILIIVVSMMIGPIMWLKPSKREQTLARLRAKAQQAGLMVSIVQHKGDNLACYRKSWQSKSDGSKRLKLIFQSRFARKDYEHGMHIAGVWSQEGDQTLPEGLKPQLEAFAKQLPDSVVAFEINTIGLGAVWKEFGGEATLDQLSELLKEYEPKISALVHSRLPEAPTDQHS